ncbi:MAG: sigma-70 family RNA polymerase sigma factor, partial [Crocinitomicaceae bacterium]
MSEIQTYDQLIERCKAWDRSGQEELYRLFSRDLWKVCMLYATDKDEASDFLHDAFMHIFKNIQSYQQKGSLEGWLRRVTVNHCLQTLRKKKKNPFAEFNENLLSVEEPHEEEEQFSFEQVLSQINLLPQKAALVLKLYAIEG